MLKGWAFDNRKFNHNIRLEEQQEMRLAQPTRHLSTNPSIPSENQFTKEIAGRRTLLSLFTLAKIVHIEILLDEKEYE